MLRFAMKRFLKEIIYFAKRFLPQKGTAVLMYHSIGDNEEFFTVSTREFERQLAYCVGRNVVLTFDDGYQDNYTNVFPLLKKYRMTARIFVATSFIGGSRILRSGHVLPMLSWDQIKEMRASGLVEFFSHTHTHPKLTELSPEEAEQEIRKSREIILGDFFAYPYGYYNPAIVNMVRNLGFLGAYTVKSGMVTAKTDPLLIPRNSIDSNVTFSMFKAIIKRGRIR